MVKHDHPWLRVFFSLRCSLDCPYCSVLNYPFGCRVNGSLWTESDPESWIEFLDVLHPSKTIVASGGEPLLYRGLVDVVNHQRNREYRIYTNGGDVSSIEKMQNPKRLNVEMSYHQSMSFDKFCKSYDRLRELGLGCLGVHVIDVPNNHAAISLLYVALKSRGYVVTISGYTGVLPSGKAIGMFGQPDEMFNGMTGDKVSCNVGRNGNTANSWWIVGPDGNVWSCVAHLLRKNTRYLLGNVFENPQVIDRKDPVVCLHYGECSICEYGRKVTRA